MSRSGVSRNTKITIGLLAVVVVGLAALFVFVERDTAGSRQDALERLVRPDSHRLSTAAGDGVTLVEFLDFECPSCAAAFPVVERLREEYAGRLTYVPRHLPLPMHRNAENAALAAEAAGQQGRFEEMYATLFQTQADWGGQPADHAATFEAYAEQLGLDLDRFRADVTHPATADRVRADQDDATALGVQGTPTFFIDGQRFEGAVTYERLRGAIEMALAR